MTETKISQDIQLGSHFTVSRVAPAWHRAVSTCVCSNIVEPPLFQPAGNVICRSPHRVYPIIYIGSEF